MQEIKDIILHGSLIEAVAAMQTIVRGYKFTPLHYGMIKTIQDNSKTITLSFRGSGKSLTCTVSYSLVRVVRDTNARILIVSGTDSQAKSLGDEIRSVIQTNPLFISLFGNLKGRKWNRHEILLNNRTINNKEPNISCYSIGNQIIGKHFDEIIADDLVGLTDAKSAKRRDDLWAWYNNVLIPTLVGEGKITVIGTCYDKDDLYARLLKLKDKNDKPLYAVFRRPALMKLDDGSFLSSCPELYSVDQLIAKYREIGKRAFLMQYNMTYDVGSAGFFDEKYIQSFDGYEINVNGCYVFNEGKRIKINHICIGTDLAAGLENNNDYFTMCAVGIDSDNNYYVLDVYHGRNLISEQYKLINDWFYRFNPRYIGVEVNGQQKMLAEELKRTNLPIKQLSRNTNKETRALGLLPKFENYRVYFNYASSRKMVLLEEELLAFPSGEHDDLFDSLETAITLCDEVIGKKPVLFGL